MHELTDIVVQRLISRQVLQGLIMVKMTPDEFVSLAKTNPSGVEKKIISYISKENDRHESGQITASTVGNVLKAIRTLLEMNDVLNLNWKKIRRILPKARRYALDRMPTTEEIQDIINVADLRGKGLTLLFISGGIREGAIEGLKVRDYTRIDRQGQKIDFRYRGFGDNNNVLASSIGRLVIYNGDPERYVTFITSETCDAIDKYLEFRAEHGIRKEPKRRHEFSVNGFRKYFKTMAEQSGMKPINVQILMGHSVGISDSYYRPTEQSLREDYLKAVDKLAVLQTSPPQQQQAMIKLSESHQVLLQQMESKEAEMKILKGQMDKMQQGLKSYEEVAEKLEVFVDRVKKEEQRRREQDRILDKQPPGWIEPYLKTELKGPLTPELRKKIQGLIEQLQNGTLPPPPD